MSSTYMPRVTIIVTQRESFVHTRRSLDSLYATTRVPFSLVYVDGGSPSRTRAYLAEQARVRGFTLVRRERFLTPNEARNIGFGLVRSEFVVFAENDVLFRHGWLEALVAEAERSNAAMVGPLISFREPEFSYVHSVGGANWFDPTPAGNFYQNVQRFKEISVADIPGTLERTEVDYIEFHCFLARTDVVRACGPFDDALRTCLEFDDFCLGVKRAGGVIVNEPAAVVHHMLPLAPPRGLGDVRFLLRRWSRADNASSAQHFRRKWNVRDDDTYLRLATHWCDGRPLSIVEATRTFQFVRRVKRGVQGLLAKAFAGRIGDSKHTVHDTRVAAGRFEGPWR